MTDFVSYKKNAITGSWEDTDTRLLNPTANLIPPMQSFIVLSTGGDLKAHPASTTVSPNNNDRLRASQNPAVATPKLSIIASRDGDRSKALLLRVAGASHDYASREDSRMLFPVKSTAPVMVYMRSRDGYALDINSIGDFSEQVALGIRTDRTGEITLEFSGMESFNGATIRLHDVLRNRTIDLSEQSQYVFTKDSEELCLENRFYLTIDGATLTVSPEEHSSISVASTRRGIHVLSNDGSPLTNVRIFDLQGRCLVNERPSASDWYCRPLPQGIDSVRATNGKTTETRKTPLNLP
jgi:hypothetical protein